MSDNPKTSVSVVVSTYNRSDSLRTCLQWLNDIARPATVSVEVIVVDNNSTDDTPAVVESARQSLNLPIVYVVERRQGASYGRNAGIRAASGDLIAFLDDDCFPHGDWLVAMVSEFENDPELDGAGGRVELYDTRDLPITIRTSQSRCEATTHNLFSCIPGCNMVFRHDTVDRIGGFDELLGPGTRVNAAEDSDFIYRAIRLESKVHYVPTLLVFHAHGRRTPDAESRLHRGYIVGRGAFYAKHAIRGDTNALRRFYWEVKNTIKRRFSSSSGNRSLRVVRYLCKGVLTYFWNRAGNPKAQSAPDVTRQ